MIDHRYDVQEQLDLPLRRLEWEIARPVSRCGVDEGQSSQQLWNGPRSHLQTKKHSEVIDLTMYEDNFLETDKNILSEADEDDLS
jgi:hypothetical protein